MTHPDSIARDINRVHNLVVQVSRSVDAVSTQVNAVDMQARETQSDLARLQQAFNDYVRKFDLRANEQAAETRIGNIRGQIHQKFGHHIRARESAIGMLQGFDNGLITEDTAHRVAEELMIENHSYWLAPCLVALAAWAVDDPELCDTAISVAFNRASDRTSLFMALVLRRQSRQAASVRWLRHYLNAQDPSALTPEFAVVLEAISQGAFGPAGLAMVREVLDQWRELLAHDESAQDAQVLWWLQEIEANRTASAANRYPRLTEVSPQWTMMDAALRSAGAHRELVTKYTAMLAAEIRPTERIEDTIDDILDRLVRDYDPEELPLWRDLAVQEMIVACKGDEELAATRIAPELVALDDRKDYLTVETMSALHPDKLGVSEATQRVAVAACSEWFARAHSTFTADYRKRVPANVEAVFEGSHNIAAKAFNLPRWVGSFTKPMSDLEQSLGQHWDRHSEPFIRGLAVNMKPQMIAAGVVSFLAFLMIGACSGFSAGGVIGGLLVAGLIAGIWSLYISNQLEKSRTNQNFWRQWFADAKRDSIAQLRGAGAELTDWTTEFRDADAVERELQAVIADFGTAGATATPFQGRLVTPAEVVQRPGA